MRMKMLAACTAAMMLGVFAPPVLAQAVPMEAVLTATNLGMIPPEGTLLFLNGPKNLSAYKMEELRFYAAKVCFKAYADGEAQPEGYEQAAGATFVDIFNRFINPENKPVLLRVEMVKTSPDEEPACSTLKYVYAHKKE